MEEKKLKKKKFKAKEDNNAEYLYFSAKDLGDLYLENENYDEALLEYRESEKAGKILGNTIYVAIANRMIGETLCFLGEFEEAITHQKTHLKLSQKEKNFVEEQRALATLGRTYFVKAESFTNPQHSERKVCLDLSRNYYQKSLVICERLADEVGHIQLSEMKSRLYLNLGLTLESQGDVTLATDYITQAINVCKRLELWENLCRCYTSQGSLYIRQQNTSAALTVIGEALKISERLDGKIACELLVLKAEAMVDLSDYRSAKRCLVQAFKKMKTSDLKEKTEIERKLRVAIVMCETETKLLQTAESDYSSLKKCNETLGDCCVTLKRYQKAIEYYENMLKFSVAAGETGKNLAAAYVSLSQTYKDNKQYGLSLEYAVKEIALYDNEPLEACRTLLNIIDTMELKQENYEKILTEYTKGINLAKKIGDTKMQSMFLKTILFIQRDRGYNESADKTEQELNSLAINLNDVSESDSSDAEEIADTIGAHIDIDELSDLESDKDVRSRDRPARKKPRLNFTLKKNEKGETPLHVAAAKGNYSLVISLLKQGHPIDVQDAVGWLPLHEACNHGHIKVVEALLDAGADVNDKGGLGCEGVTPLHDAAASGHLEIIDLLLDRGASPLSRTDNGETVLDCLKNCRERVVGESGKELDPSTLAHYNSIVSRLESALKKAGYSGQKTDKTNLSRTNKLKSTSVNNYNKSSERSFIQNRNHLFDEDFPTSSRVQESRSQNVSNKNAAVDYKETMESLRRKDKRKQMRTTEKKSNLPAWLNSSDVSDDWLEDDIGDYDKRPVKRMCGQFVGTHLRTVKNESTKSDRPSYPSANTSVRSPTRGGLSSSSLDDIFKAIDNDEELIADMQTTCATNSTDHVRSLRQNCDQFEEVNFQTKNAKHQNLRHNMKHQKSLLSVGFKKFMPSSTSTQNGPVTSSSSSSSSSSQRKSDNEPSIPSAVIPINQTAAATTTTVPCNNVSCAIKVRVENKLFLIPITDNEHVLTIGWLVSETVRRYYNAEGNTPTISLTTEDGALLDENDPLSIVTNSKELRAVIESWNLAPLMDRYKEACAAAHIGVDKYIETQLDICQATSCFLLKDCPVPLNALSPALKAISHYHNLTKLVLTGINLQDQGFKIVVDSIAKLPQLHLLDVSVNNITYEGMIYYARIVSQNPVMQTMESLDLSFNLLTGESVPSLHKLFNSFPHLKSLKLKQVGLTADSLYTSQNFSFDCIETLDVSNNQLDREGIIKFLSCLDASKIKHLDVGYTGGPEILKECILFFESSKPDNLCSLSLACLNLNDSDVTQLARALSDADQIMELNLSCNWLITAESHKCISQVKTLKKLYLDGCSPLTKNHELDLPFCKLTLSSDMHISNHFEMPYKCITNEIS